MNNIFENAYFGKAYKTRSGKKAILLQPKTYHVILEDLTEYSVMKDGLAYDDMTTSYDIVSEWQEEIDEEELDGIAWCKAREEYIDDYR